MSNSRPPGADRPALAPLPTVEDSVSTSTNLWARDLRSLFEHAKDRFGDVVWETEDGGEKIWGHKAVIYARAPKAFKERYFISRPYARSPSSLRSPSPSRANGHGHFLPPLFPSSRPSSPPSSFRRPSTRAGTHSSLSVNTQTSDHTLRAPSAAHSTSASSDGILRLTHGDTPALFQAQLEWLYTGEGFGDVVEWISAEEDAPQSLEGGSLRDSLGRRGNKSERRDKLGQDLTYMWRSKLYADVRIHLNTDFSSNGDEGDESDSDSSVDSLSSTAVFTSHRFILATRSPYFASVLLNPSSFKPNTADIHLPTPPFTPAALHFCLGYMYAGHLDFSNRSFDLLTAFQIHRAAAYLQLDSLTGEIESRIAWDFCHGLDWHKCHCKRCAPRAARVWKFASAPDIGAMRLAALARAYVVMGWGEAWGKEVGLLDTNDKDALVRDVVAAISARNVVSSLKSVASVRHRIENGLRHRGRDAAIWVEGLEGMLERVEAHVRAILIDEFAEVAEGKEIWDLVSGKGFSDDLLQLVVQEVIGGVGTSQGCVEGPRVYQALVSSVLLKVDPDTLEAALSPRSRSRGQIEMAREGILAHIRRRWMQIRDAGGFAELDNWALKEISDEIEVSVDDLVASSSLAPPSAKKVVKTSEKPRLPRTTSRIQALSDAASVRSAATRTTQLSRTTLRTASARVPPAAPAGSSAPGGIRTVSAPVTGAKQAASVTRPTTPPDSSSGLKRLRLSSSASTSSAASLPRPGPSKLAQTENNSAAPSARSPTAARTGPTVAIGGPGRVRAAAAKLEAGRKSPTPPAGAKAPAARSMSGGMRPLLTRNAATQKPTSTPTSAEVGRPTSPAKAPSIASVKTTRTTRSTATTTPAAITAKSATTTPENKPPRPRLDSSSTVASTRSRVKTGVDAQTAPGGMRRAAAGPSKLNPSPAAPSGRRSPSIMSTMSTRSKAQPVAATAGLRGTPKPPASRTEAGATRLRTTSSATTASVRSNVSKVPPLPVPSAPNRLSSPSKPSSAANRLRAPPTGVAGKAFPSSAIATTGKTKLRSPSSSTDDGPEAKTPRTSDISHPIIREGSSSSHSNPSPTPPVTSKLPPTAVPLPPVSMPRAVRKISASSTISTASALRPHPASAFDPPKRPSVLPTGELPKIEITDGSTPFSGRGVLLHVGIPCIVSLSTKRARFRAQVRYIGLMEGKKGPWVGVEVDGEGMSKYDVQTLPSGSVTGTHYFSVSALISESPTDLDIKMARQRKVETIQEGLKRKSKFSGIGLGLGSVGLSPGSRPAGSMGAGIRGRRSVSPFVGPGGGASASEWGPRFEHPRAMFVRPSEVVFVMGAE